MSVYYIRVDKYKEYVAMEQIAPVLKAISNESRLRILNLLISRGELCVCDIEAILGATQTKVSRHLAYLRRSGLVSARRSGLWILYSIPPTPEGPRRDVLSLLPSLLSTNDIARRDLKRLDARMRRGCCATTNVARPAIMPAVLEVQPQ
jgi:ArsR family transcriptional regulator, arsenate/arsenite/antimonite-responsive transcriptional repressor